MSLDSWKPLLEKAVDTANKGVELDLKNNFEEAVKLYDESVSIFTDCMENKVDNDMVKEMIKNKLEKYKKRSEQLKRALSRYEAQRQAQTH